mmetsp:Transcript_18337/g.44161  ORF Transcript_18337/g.44161 Transcript_18337/m.44161 type:complete len:412 (-) Transcript_18337:190-1425(-)
MAAAAVEPEIPDDLETHYSPDEIDQVEHELDEAAHPAEEDFEHLPDVDSQQSSQVETDFVAVHALVWPDDFTDPKHCLPNGALKPRRGIPQIRYSDLLAGCQQVDGQWMFAGPLNGWPGLVNLQLVSLTLRVSSRFTMRKIKRLWNGQGELPDKVPIKTRATLRMGGWAKIGWSPESRGFCWWYEQLRPEPRVLFGESMIAALDHADSKAVRVHLYAHRYPKSHESLKDRILWHALLLLEWDHQKFTTVVELGLVNGVGGYAGKSAWLDDIEHPCTQLYRLMPDALKLPWNERGSEIRCVDMPFTTSDEFYAHMKKHSEKGELKEADCRWVAPEHSLTESVRLSFCKRSDIARYLVNYLCADTTYDQLTRNCQTMAADLFSLLTGKSDVQPFHAVCRPGYSSKKHRFLYSS